LSSKGEEAVKEALEALGVAFQRQYRFNDCKNKRSLPFDFAVLSNNVVFGLIEFHGRQHFEEVAYFGGGDGHRAVITRDKIKVAYCEKKGLPLLAIPYWYIDRVHKMVEDFIDIHKGFVKAS
jgi:hypothetical protein